jgi:hypothetical protein
MSKQNLTVEYLVIIDNKSIKSTNERSFNSLLQSDPEISVAKNCLTYKNLSVAYSLESGNVNKGGEVYFHLTFICSEIERIEEFTSLLRAVKSVLHLANKTPQTLYDGLSLYYTQLAYPLIFKVESLMRKLITKFMLTNVGVDWTKDHVPDDVKSSINKQNNDLTYLHNVDFIQLKNFLFSENFPTHKDALIKKLKGAVSIDEVKIEELKSLIPTSNWDRFFSEKVDVTKEQLAKQWDELYDLRCKVAHNRTFDKGEYEIVIRLHDVLSNILEKANANLTKIDISKDERDSMTETIASSFHYNLGTFVATWNELENVANELIKCKIYPHEKDPRPFRRFQEIVDLLYSTGLIDARSANAMLMVYRFRNRVVHGLGEHQSEEELQKVNSIARDVSEKLRGYL